MPDRVGRTRPLRIAHVTTSDISLALLLATELSEAVAEGHTVLGISAPGPYVERVTALGVEHIAVPALSRSWGLGRDARAFVCLWRTFRKLKLDVVHTHNPKTGVMGRIAGRLARVPVVVNTCHGLWATPQDSLAKRIFVYGLEGLAARFSDYELFQNAQDERTLQKFLKPGRHRVVGNGIDLEHFRYDPQDRSRLRAAWGVADDEMLVGTVGRRVREKGLREFATAASSLTDEARFVWVGPEDSESVDSGADECVSTVQFIPEQTDMPAVYSAFDVFVLASYREGFSRASMEAAACGRPMILSDIRGCREIGIDRSHLLLAAPADAASLTSKIAELLNDGELRARLGTAAERRAREEFDQRRVARMSRETYDAVIRSKAGSTAKRIRVLHVLPQDRRRGAQVYAGRLRDQLRSSQSQDHKLVSLFDGPLGAMNPDIRLKASDGVLRRVIHPRALWRLRRLIRRTRPDIVIAHGGEPLKYVVPASVGLTRTVYYKIGLSTAELSRVSRRLLYQKLANRVDHVTAVSNDVADQIHEVLDVPRHRITVIPNGRDPGTYFPAARQPTGAPLVLFVGQLEDGKRPCLFLDAIEDLRTKRMDFRAAIVGEGPVGAELREPSSRLDVAMLGSRDDVPELLRQAALVMVTSAPDTEGLPGVVVEAGLSGIPVVSTDAAGVRDVIIDEVTGLISSTGSPEHLASLAASLLRDPARRSELGSAAREHCEERFSMAASASAWESFVDVVTSLSRSRSHR